MHRILLALPWLAAGSTARAQAYSHMGDWGYGYGPAMMFGPVLWLIVLGLVVVGVIWLVRQLDPGRPRPGRSAALDELDLRLARGEIDIAEHAAKRKALSG